MKTFKCPRCGADTDCIASMTLCDVCRKEDAKVKRLQRKLKKARGRV